MNAIEDAVAALERGALVVLPTDSVYGLAARLHPATVAELIRIKARPPDKPLPVLGSTAGQLASVAVLDETALVLARDFWPGPLTLVLPRAEGFDLDLGGGPDTVGVRIPAHEVARALLERAGPLAVTSANRSGEPPATTVDEARVAFGDEIPVYLDGGLAAGTPSTVVSLVGRPLVLRDGILPGADVLSRIEPP